MSLKYTKGAKGLHSPGLCCCLNIYHVLTIWVTELHKWADQRQAEVHTARFSLHISYPSPFLWPLNHWCTFIAHETKVFDSAHVSFSLSIFFFLSLSLSLFLCTRAVKMQLWLHHTTKQLLFFLLLWIKWIKWITRISASCRCTGAIILLLPVSLPHPLAIINGKIHTAIDTSLIVRTLSSVSNAIILNYRQTHFQVAFRSVSKWTSTSTVSDSC